MKKVAFLSTYPPRECGLATFTEDLVNEFSKAGMVRPCVIAVGLEDYEDPRVQYMFRPHECDSYSRAAEWANTHADLLVIEHEYGIFGGECGEHILNLAKALKIPIIVTTHTVLLEPSEKQRAVLGELGRLSTKVVTMAKSSIPILSATYGIDSGKLEYIPHGVPSLQVDSREKLKTASGLKNKQVISSFGLLSPAKGLEYGIEAVSKVVAECENIVYLILGKTHP
jgi:glycosyltransferase involved in cell wall biosynthesis